MKSSARRGPSASALGTNGVGTGRSVNNSGINRSQGGLGFSKVGDSRRGNGAGNADSSDSRAQLVDQYGRIVTPLPLVPAKSGSEQHRKQEAVAQSLGPGMSSSQGGANNDFERMSVGGFSDSASDRASEIGDDDARSVNEGDDAEAEQTATKRGRGGYNQQEEDAEDATGHKAAAARRAAPVRTERVPAAELDRLVTLTLRETETVTLFHAPAVRYSAEVLAGGEARALAAEQAHYENAVAQARKAGGPGSDLYPNRGTHTLHPAVKSKEVQVVPSATRTREAQVSSFDIHDTAVWAAAQAQGQGEGQQGEAAGPAVVAQDGDGEGGEGTLPSSSSSASALRQDVVSSSNTTSSTGGVHGIQDVVNALVAVSISSPGCLLDPDSDVHLLPRALIDPFGSGQGVGGKGGKGGGAKGSKLGVSSVGGAGGGMNSSAQTGSSANSSRRNSFSQGGAGGGGGGTARGGGATRAAGGGMAGAWGTSSDKERSGGGGHGGVGSGGSALDPAAAAEDRLRRNSGVWDVSGVAGGRSRAGSEGGSSVGDPQSPSAGSMRGSRGLSGSAGVGGGGAGLGGGGGGQGGTGVGAGGGGAEDVSATDILIRQQAERVLSSHALSEALSLVERAVQQNLFHDSHRLYRSGPAQDLLEKLLEAGARGGHAAAAAVMAGHAASVRALSPEVTAGRGAGGGAGFPADGRERFSSASAAAAGGGGGGGAGSAGGGGRLREPGGPLNLRAALAAGALADEEEDEEEGGEEEGGEEGEAAGAGAWGRSGGKGAGEDGEDEEEEEGEAEGGRLAQAPSSGVRPTLLLDQPSSSAGGAGGAHPPAGHAHAGPPPRGGPSVQRLFTYTCPIVRGYNVTCMNWNKRTRDLLAVGYGPYDFAGAASSSEGGGGSSTTHTSAHAASAGPAGAPGAGSSSSGGSSSSSGGTSNASKGFIALWAMSNPEHPQALLRTPGGVGVTSLDFSASMPNILAAGCYDGSVCLWDVSLVFTGRSDGSPALVSNKLSPGAPSDAVWQVQWVRQTTSSSTSAAAGAGGTEETLVSISTDGKVTEWSWSKGLQAAALMTLKRSRGAPPVSSSSATSAPATAAGGAAGSAAAEPGAPPSSSISDLPAPAKESRGEALGASGSEGLLSRTAVGLALDFSPADSSLYYLGTEDGLLAKCSTSYTEQYLEVVSAHAAPVNRVHLNPFLPTALLTGGGDGVCKLWNVGAGGHAFTKAACVAYTPEGAADSIADVAWSPSVSTRFASVSRDGHVRVWDAGVLTRPVVDALVHIEAEDYRAQLEAQCAQHVEAARRVWLEERARMRLSMGDTEPEEPEALAAEESKDEDLQEALVAIKEAFGMGPSASSAAAADPGAAEGGGQAAGREAAVGKGAGGQGKKERKRGGFGLAKFHIPPPAPGPPPKRLSCVLFADNTHVLLTGDGSGRVDVYRLMGLTGAEDGSRAPAVGSEAHEVQLEAIRGLISSL